MLINLKPLLPNDGDHMTMEDFTSACKANAFTDDDGIGYLATSGHVSNMVIDPSYLASDKKYNANFTHVLWYNK